jgi:hypothetical protein
MFNTENANPTSAGCTFSGNLGYFGNALAFDPESPSNLFMANCILWDGGDEVWNADGSTITVVYSDVQGGWSGDGPGNIDADPMFVDPANGDFRLSLGSPCIDAGHNWGVAPDLADLDADGDTAELTPVDLDGNPRFVHAPVDAHPGCGVPAIVDMGAYEFPDGTALDIRLGDIDGDGVVGCIDFLLLMDAWGACPAGCCLADFDLDGVVGVLDFLKLLRYWG